MWKENRENRNKSRKTMWYIENLKKNVHVIFTLVYKEFEIQQKISRERLVVVGPPRPGYVGANPLPGYAHPPPPPPARGGTHKKEAK